MEKRLLLALILSLLFLWSYVSITGPPPEPGGTGGQTSVTSAPDARAPQGGVPGAAGDLAAGGAGAAGAAGLTEGEPLPPGDPVPFAGKGFVAQFDSRGAGLEWLDLTEYHTEPGGDVDLRLVGGPHDPIRSFLLRDFDRRHGLDTGLWEVASSTDEQGLHRLVFTHRGQDGLVFRRTVSSTDDPYMFRLEVSVENEGDAAPPGSLMLVMSGAHGLVDDQGNSLFAAGMKALALVDEGRGSLDMVRWSGDDLKSGTPRRVGDGERLLCAGSMSNYFAAVLVPDEGTYVAQVQPFAAVEGVLLDADVRKRLGENAPPADVERAARDLASEHMTNPAVDLLLAGTPPAPGARTAWSFSVYAGPKDRSLGERPAYAPWLLPVLDESFGSMAFINHALLAILRFFEWLTHNWGVAIILLTVVVRALLFPLNRVQQSSMAKYAAVMQRLKPEIDALKAKYKNNTKKFNEEQMKLLREHGATPPLGGCLLMFVQMPIWFSLFQILRSSIELRHAPFAGWVLDLSKPDQMPLPFPVFGLEHLNLLPVLMSAAMIVQMRFTAKTADPSQAQMQRTMAMIMPVMMLFILYSYPAGLSLYILTSSLLGIFEYQVIRRYWPPPSPASLAAAPAAARPAARKGARARG